MTDTYIHNLVDNSTTKYSTILRTFLTNMSGGVHSLTNAFYKLHGDDYDFLFFVLEWPMLTNPLQPGMVTPTPGFREIRRPLCPGLGFTTPYDAGQSHGSPSRLTGVITLPMFMPEDGGAPTSNHEIMHNWGVYLKGDFGFAEAKSHWGHFSANGSLGGFDVKTLRTHDGKPIADPLSVAPNSRVRLARFAAAGSSLNRPYSPFELYLMGLVDRSEIDAVYYRMVAPKFIGYQDSDALYEVGGFTSVTLDQILAANAGGPPKATQTAFRGGWVLVSEAPAAPAVLAKAERFARLCGGVELDKPPPTRSKWLSFAEATGGRATMDCRLTPRVTAG